MGAKDILEQLIDPKTLKIIRVFFENDKKQFYLREISKLTEVSPASSFRILNKLVDLKIIDLIKSAKFKTYRLSDNETTRFLGQLIKKQKQVLQILVTRIKDIKELEEVILYGKEEKDKANILLIGANIPVDAAKDVCSSIKEEFNYTITPLILTREQFEQMDRMGLYPEKKRVLFRK